MKNTNQSSLSIDPQRLRQARLRRGITIEEAARLAQINKMTLQRYETGDIRSVCADRLSRLAALYGVPAAWLTGVSPDAEHLLPDQGLLLIAPGHPGPAPGLGRRLLAAARFLNRQGANGRQADSL